MSFMSKYLETEELTQEDFTPDEPDIMDCLQRVRETLNRNKNSKLSANTKALGKGLKSFVDKARRA